MKKNNRQNPDKLSRSQVQVLLGGAVPDEELTRIGAGEGYVLPDGRAMLVFETGRGIVYRSRHELIALVDTVSEQAKIRPEHPAKHLMPQAKDFVVAVPELLEQLAVASVWISVRRTQTWAPRFAPRRRQWSPQGTLTQQSLIDQESNLRHDARTSVTEQSTSR